MEKSFIRLAQGAADPGSTCCVIMTWYFCHVREDTGGTYLSLTSIKMHLSGKQNSLFKGAVGSADLKISKSVLLSLNHHKFSNTKPIYIE